MQRHFVHFRVFERKKTDWIINGHHVRPVRLPEMISGPANGKCLVGPLLSQPSGNNNNGQQQQEKKKWE